MILASQPKILGNHVYVQYVLVPVCIVIPGNGSKVYLTTTQKTSFLEILVLLGSKFIRKWKFL